MARRPIDIGTIGNDGTGDSIRDAFRKVNDNFRELYSSLGLGDRLRFIGLDDTPESYVGQENSILTVNTIEEGVAFRQLVAGAGMQIDFSSNENQIVLTNLLSDISGDSRPNLGGPLSAESGTIRYPIGNMVDISNSSELAAAKSRLQSAHGTAAASADRIAANKKYVDTKISLAGVDSIDPDTGVPDTRFGTMSGPLILSRNPIPEDDVTYDGLIAATKKYVDNSGFGSAVNLYVATSGLDDRSNLAPGLQGRALPYAYRTIEAALKKAEELVLDAPIEIGPYKKILTYGGGEFDCYLQAIDFSNGIPLNPATFTVKMSSDSIELESGGNLYLPGDRLTVVGGTFDEPIRLEVLTVNAIQGTGGRGPVVTFRLLTTGVYSVLPGSSAVTSTATSSTGGSTFGSGATFNITYKLNNIVVGNSGGSGYGLVSITFSGGGGGTGASARANVIGGVIQGVTVTNKGSGYTTPPNLNASLPRFFIFTGGQRTDFTGELGTGPGALRTRDIREGLLLRGETSGAIAQILAHTGQLSTVTGFENSEVFDVDVLQGEFLPGEAISYGDVTKPIQICVLVEAGIYQENFPLKIPQNVAIIGDEFRRTIVRPRLAVADAPLSGMSSSPWAFQNFRRDPDFDGMDVAEQLYGYHYLSDPTVPVYPLLDNNGNRRAAAEILSLNREFIKEQVIGWIRNQIITAEPGDLFEGFEYNEDICRRDIGLIIDSMTFDLKYGGYARTISSALKYYQSVSSLIAITTQLSETMAGISRINTLAQDVISNTEITVLYTTNGTEFDPANGQQAQFSQIIDQAYVAEAGSSTIISDLIDIILDIIENSGAANYPKDNNQMDMFLCNDANIIRAVTGQGQGGFMMVLDPEGQILTKSPYCQESASFSRSTGFKTFAGGMFVDGFTGNQRFFIESTESAGDPPQPGLIVNISGLLRVPQTPCSFIVSDIIYRINYIRNYNYGILPPGDPLTTTEGGYSIAQLILDETTPFTGSFGDIACTFSLSLGELIITVAGGHGLQIRAIVQFKTTGTLPAGLQTFKDYYVIADGFTETTFKITDQYGTNEPLISSNTGAGSHTFQRVFEILMPGNRSMLSNDYTQVNDLGYGLVVANGGLTEAVSMFTYYTQISYFALTGGQIRSIGGSSSHGNYALVAKGSDPLEVPTPVGLYHKLSQGVMVYALGSQYVNSRGDLQIFVQYDDYYPLSGSELELNHNNVITRYAITTINIDNLAQKIVRLGIGSSGGIEFAVPHGQRAVLRQNSFVVLTGDVVEVATRPSTALVLNDAPFVYRILEFNDYDSNIDKDDIEIVSINTGTGLITTTIPHRQVAGYTVKIKRVSGTLPDAIIEEIDSPPAIGNVYYVVSDGLTPTTFKISNTKDGPVLDLSTGGSYTGVSKVIPYGLALTQLRENYNYVVLDLYAYQPFRTPGSLINGTVVPASDWITTATTYPIHSQISFTATSFPAELEEQAFYYVVTDNFVANTRFSITDDPPIFHSQIGVGLYNTVTQRITGLKSTANMVEGMRLIPVPSITSVSATAVGTSVTLTFSQRPRAPFVLGTQVTVSGFGVAAYNGTWTLTGVTNSTIRYTSSIAPAGPSSGGTISLPSTYGTLPTNATIAIGGIIGPTEIEITGVAGSPLGGTVAFNVEGEKINLSTTGSNVKFGNLIGDQGQNTVAITKLPDADTTRVLNGEFLYDGDSYIVTNYVELQDYGLVTLNTALNTSAIATISPIAFKIGVPVPSVRANGTLTIRIALVRVTSHDFLEIGTGGYADTNYPNDIFGSPVNDFNTVPLYATDTESDETSGETLAVTRAQVQERDVGRVFFVTTDQYGNFSVGPFFKVDQGTGTVTFAASIALSQLDGLGFKRGTTVSEFSTDDRMIDEFNDTVPTEAAVAGFVARRLGNDRDGNALLASSLIPAGIGGFMPLSGNLTMKGNMDLGNFQIKNLAVPTLLTDAARLDSINITNLKDTDGTDLFEFNNIQAAQLVAFTGANNVMSNFTPVGDVVFDIQIGDSTANVIRTEISPNVIVNADVNSSAAIAQSKLSMVEASTRVNAVGITQADRGLASFDDAQFTATNGWITVKDNGLALTKIAQIASDTVLGNSTGAVANVTAVTFATVVNEGGAVKKGQYSGSVGYLKRTNATVGNHTDDSHYSIVQDSSAADANRLVIRDANADFAGRQVTVDILKLKAATTGTYDGIKANEVTTTTGFTEILGYNGGGGSNFAGIQIGAGVGNQRTLYNNTEHTFRSQNGATNFATISSTGINLGTLTVTAASLASCTSISTGAEGTAGSVTGSWTLTGSSRWQSTYAADLAEYYEGDKAYEVGTVLVFGGDKEVTESTSAQDHRVAGVVSDTAAYSMYGACPGFKNQIALQGRVPCKVKGKIRKGDLLVTSDIPGVAMAAIDPKAGTILGKAIENYDSDAVGTIIISVGRT